MCGLLSNKKLVRLGMFIFRVVIETLDFLKQIYTIKFSQQLVFQILKTDIQKNWDEIPEPTLGSGTGILVEFWFHPSKS